MVTPLRRLLTVAKNIVTGSQDSGFEALRDFARADVNAEVRVFLGGETLNCNLRDVSISGALLVPDCGMEKGAVFELELDSIPGRVEAEVMRLTDAGAGIRFANHSIGVLVAGWSRGTSSGAMAVGSGGNRR